MSRRSRLIRKLPLVVWLTVVWVMLWGTLDPGTVFFGVVVALLVIVLFPMPSITTNIVVRPLRVLNLALYLAWDLLISTLRVAWQAVRHGPGTKAGIVAVTLLTDSDHLVAMTANAISLAPGKFVMQIDRTNRICYVYALGMRAEDAETVRRETLRLEAKVVRAVGSAADVALVEAHRRGEG